jgi:uncharacterized membrane protein YhiD involved in acid resistance
MTAAAIWVVAAIGLACGAGMLIEAGITTLFTIAVLILLHPLRQRLHRSPGAYALRAAPGIESVLVNLRNPTSAIAPFPLFAHDRAAEDVAE